MPVNTIKPYRDYSEHEVLNGFYAYDGPTPAFAGTFVKINSGWLPDQHSSILGTAGQSYPNTVSPRWGLPAKVIPVNGSGDNTVGFILYDVRETDENGEKLLFHPRKAKDNNWTISGASSPVCQRGFFFFSGIPGTITAGAPVFLGTDGGLNASGSIGNTSVTKVGQFMSVKDTFGWTLVKVAV